MHALVIILPLLTANVFASDLDHALALAQNKEWAAAASVLDQAVAEDAASFAANNLHYLRGRIAENQKEWSRALSEFEAIELGNPLHDLALLHAAKASLHLGNVDRAGALTGELPADFPAAMKLQLAREAPQELALKIYGGLTSR